MGSAQQASLTLNGAAGAPLVGLFILGACFSSTNWIGALTGAISGLGFSLWLSVGAYVNKPLNFKLPVSTHNCTVTRNLTTDVTFLPFTVTPTTMMTQNMTYSPSDPDQLEGLDNFYGLSYLWFSALGIITTVLVGLIVSWATGRTEEFDVPDEYQLHFFKRLKSCLQCKESFQDYTVTEDITLDKLDMEISVGVPDDQPKDLQDDPKTLNGITPAVDT